MFTEELPTKPPICKPAPLADIVPELEQYSIMQVDVLAPKIPTIPPTLLNPFTLILFLQLINCVYIALPANAPLHEAEFVTVKVPEVIVRFLTIAFTADLPFT